MDHTGDTLCSRHDFQTAWLRTVPSFDQSGPEGTKSALKKWVRQSIKLGFTKASQKYHAPDKTDGWF